MKLFDHIAEIADEEGCFVAVLIDEIESIASARQASVSSNEPSDAVRWLPFGHVLFICNLCAVNDLCLIDMCVFYSQSSERCADIIGCPEAAQECLGAMHFQYDLCYRSSKYLLVCIENILNYGFAIGISRPCRFDDLHGSPLHPRKVIELL